VPSFVENKSNSTELKNKEDEDSIPIYINVSDEKRYKNLQKKLESIHDYTSFKDKGKCWAQELFKAYGFAKKTYGIIFRALAPSTFVNYQYGWGIFADFVLDIECCEHINKIECQIVYNKFLEWLQELSDESRIPNENENQTNEWYLDVNLDNTKKKVKIKIYQCQLLLRINYLPLVDAKHQFLGCLNNYLK
jgi:hypothetical protein